MNKSSVEIIINGLKSSQISIVQDALAKIRNEVIITSEGVQLFREAKGLQILILLLYKSNETILDLTLSILGNCCLDEQCSILVGQLNCFEFFVQILKIANKDSILGRACRVVGNLSQKQINAEGLHKHGIVSSLLHVIEIRDKITSNTTLAMAVRAIRNLWRVVEKRDEMLYLNTIEAITKLMVTECESSGLMTKENNADFVFKKSQEELLNTILKCLAFVTVHVTPSVIEQFDANPSSYKCLVTLTKVFKNFAIKIILNMCYLTNGRLELGKAGVVECLVCILDNVPVARWPEGMGRCLAQLSGESVNRSRMLLCGGLTLLVAASKHSPHAMHALLQYVFDDNAFQLLVNQGLITILVEQLKLYLKVMKYEHDCKDGDDDEPVPQCSTSNDAQASGHDSLPDQQDDNKQHNATKRKRHYQSSSDEDDTEVIIERDNMLVGFLEEEDSLDSDEEKYIRAKEHLISNKYRRRRASKKRCGLTKLSTNKWSSSIFWEPKSPESPTTKQDKSLDRDLSHMSPVSDGYQSGFSPEYRSSAFSKRMRFDWSPESGFAGESSSAWGESQRSSASMTPVSPCSADNESSDSDIPGRYSPVCSDHSDRVHEDDLAAAQVTDDLDDLIVNDDSDNDEALLKEALGKPSSTVEYTKIGCVLVLFYRVAHGICNKTIREDPNNKNPLDTLTASETLHTLLDYIERCRRPFGRGFKILSKIICNPLSILNLLKSRIVLRLDNMASNPKHVLRKCLQCKQMTRLVSKFSSQVTGVVEGCYAVGQISYQFKLGSTDMKHSMALTLPYITSNLRHLKKFYIECDGLNILIDLLAESSENIDIGVIALEKIANCVKIKNPKKLETRFRNSTPVSYNPMVDSEQMEHLVTFEFDDSSTLQVNKTFLCDNSDVFSAMLLGNFRESIENNVRLKNVSKEAFEYVLTLLYHSVSGSTGSGKAAFPMPQDLETILDALVLADRYLLENIKVQMSSAIVQFHMNPRNVIKIYEWSLNDGMGHLCVESIAYLLTGKMTKMDRVALLKTVFNMEYKKQCVHDIKAIIFRQLAQGFN